MAKMRSTKRVGAFITLFTKWAAVKHLPGNDSSRSARYVTYWRNVCKSLRQVCKSYGKYIVRHEEYVNEKENHVDLQEKHVSMKTSV